jgi:hypothetical protein
MSLIEISLRILREDDVYSNVWISTFVEGKEVRRKQGKEEKFSTPLN